MVELSWNRIGRNGVKVKTENEKFAVVCSRSPKYLEFGHFTLLFCRGRQRNVQKHIKHVQSYCFCSLNLFVLWRSRCRRRRCCLRSLMTAVLLDIITISTTMNNNNLFLDNPAVFTWRSLYKRQWRGQRILDRFFLACIQVNCGHGFVLSLSF